MKKILIWNIIADALLSACCAVACACAVPSAYGAPYILPAILLVEVPFAFLVSFVLHRAHKPYRAAIWLAAAVLAYLVIAADGIFIGAKLAWYNAADVLSLDFSFIPAPAAPPETQLDPDVYITAFLVFVAALITVISTLLLVKCRSKIPSLLLPLPFYIPALIYIDSAPALYTAAMLVIYWGGVLFGQNRKKRARERAGVGKAIFILLLAAVALLITYVSPEGKFTPIPFSERRGLFDTVGSVRDNLRSHRLENPTEVDLVSEGERRNDLDTAFSFSCSREGALYLRSHSYGLYSMNKWAAAKEYPPCSLRIYAGLRHFRRRILHPRQRQDRLRMELS